MDKRGNPSKSIWYTFSMSTPGILLNAATCLITAGVATALHWFFFSRRPFKDAATWAYAIFWSLTSITWIMAAVRYVRVWLGHPWDEWSILLQLILEASVFFSAIPLTVYLCHRLKEPKLMTYFATTIAGIGALAALLILTTRDGISPPVYTYFSAEPTIHRASLAIFSILATAIWVLLVIDVVRGISEYRRYRIATSLYSIAPFVYLTLGVIDQAKLIIDWPLLVFRALYASSFLFVYLLVRQNEFTSEHYLHTNMSDKS